MTAKNSLALCIAIFLLLFMVETCYADSSTILVSKYGHDIHENDIAKHLAEYIYDCCVASSYTTYNWYGSSTTEENIYDAAYGLGDPFAISFYKGHGDEGMVVADGIWEWHSWILDNSGDNVFDMNIHPHSECENLRFAFLWSCDQGDKIGGTHCSGHPYGMPHAWLHTNDLSEDGYADPDENGYTFIGFYDPAPQFWRPLGGRPRAGYYFAGYFYQKALRYGESITSALDYAARWTWGSGDPNYKFSDCILRTGYVLEGKEGKMVVYGDGNLEIGSASYTPPLPTRFLKISAESPLTTNPMEGTHVYYDGTPVSVTASPSQYFGHWTLDNVVKYANPISFTMDADHTLVAFEGGSCPTLFVWDGTDYVEEGTLDIHAESDVTVQHEIQNTLALKHGVYNLQLRELDNYTSHIDQVKLYAVDYEGEWHRCPLIYAKHNDSYVTWKLLFDDENRIDLTPTQTVNLKFLRLFPYSQTAYFIFEINGYNPKGNGFPL